MINVFYPYNDFNAHCEEQESCEFVDFLLRNFADDSNSVSFCMSASSGRNTIFMYQLLAPATMRAVHTVRSLLEEALATEHIALESLSRSLIL